MWHTVCCCISAHFCSISSRFHNTRLLPHLSDFTSDSQHWLLTRNGEAPAKLPRPCHCLVVGRQNVRAMENARVAAWRKCRQVIIATALMILPPTKTMVPRFPSHDDKASCHLTPSNYHMKEEIRTAGKNILNAGKELLWIGIYNDWSIYFQKYTKSTAVQFNAHLKYLKKDFISPWLVSMKHQQIYLIKCLDSRNVPSSLSKMVDSNSSIGSNKWLPETLLKNKMKVSSFTPPRPPHSHHVPSCPIMSHHAPSCPTATLRASFRYTARVWFRYLVRTCWYTLHL